jgi:hypothetical protein
MKQRKKGTDLFSDLPATGKWIGKSIRKINPKNKSVPFFVF